jgi:hypothetical protein
MGFRSAEAFASWLACSIDLGLGYFEIRYGMLSATKQSKKWIKYIRWVSLLHVINYHLS